MNLQNKIPKNMKKPHTKKEPTKFPLKTNLTQKKLKCWNSLAKYILDVQSINKGLQPIKKVDNLEEKESQLSIYLFTYLLFSVTIFHWILWGNIG